MPRAKEPVCFGLRNGCFVSLFPSLKAFPVLLGTPGGVLEDDHHEEDSNTEENDHRGDESTESRTGDEAAHMPTVIQVGLGIREEDTLSDLRVHLMLLDNS